MIDPWRDIPADTRSYAVGYTVKIEAGYAGKAIRVWSRGAVVAIGTPTARSAAASSGAITEHALVRVHCVSTAVADTLFVEDSVAVALCERAACKEEHSQSYDNQEWNAHGLPPQIVWVGKT
jgi:hypothetical protein